MEKLTLIAYTLLFLITSSAHALHNPHTHLKASSKKDFMTIQWPGNRDHFFEGWYHRLVDREKKLSMVVITTAYNTRGITRPGIKNGYVSVIIKRDGSPAVVHQEKIDEVYLESDLQFGYRLTIPHIGHVTDSSFDLNIAGIKVHSSWSNERRLPWPTSSVTRLDTPAGLAAYLQFFPTHWHVHNMGGEVDYYIQSEKHSIIESGTATFHHEKNWGKVFPYYWYWLDVMDKSQGVYISGAGGKIRLSGVNIPAFLLAIRTPVGTLSLSPLNKFSKYKIESNNCTQFKISGSDKNLLFELELTDKGENFFNLLIPTKEGYVPGALESVTAQANLKLWKKTPRGKRKFLAAYTIDQSAIEFGNEAYRCD